MDNEQAKLILSAYRSSGEDLTEPFFVEALEQTRRDPALGRWFEDQCDFDKAINAALTSEAPPSHLRESLLLGKKLVNFDEQNKDARHVWWMRRTSWVALAAAVILLFGIAAIIRPTANPPMTAERFVQAAVHIKTSGQISLGKMAKDSQKLQTWLGTKNAPHDFLIPKALNALASLGCQTYSMDGSKVSLICFTLDQDRNVHLFVIDSDRLKNPPGSSPSFEQKEGVVTATWSSGGRTFVLLGSQVTEETLRRLI